MKISYIEIAKSALCTEGAVRAAVSSKRVNPDDLGSVLAFVLAGRLKAIGIQFCDELGGVKTGAELMADKHTTDGLTYDQRMMKDIGYVPEVEE